MLTSSDYQSTLDRLERDRAHAQSVADAFALAIESIKAAVQAEEVEPVVSARRRLGGGPLRGAKMKEAVIFAMRYAKVPIKVRDMYEIALSHGWTYDKEYESFRGSIAPTLKRDPTFARVGTGRYTLAETV